LEGGADVNQADSVYGRTALHEAAVGGSLFRLEPFSKEYAEEAQTETVRILLERGANKEVRDKDGNTALDLARKAKAENVVRILESSARTRAGSLANR
jgi:ankyrin repeat protein